MIKAKILSIQDNFKFIFEKSYYKLSNEIKEAIIKNWNFNKNKNSNLFNGTVIALKEITKERNNFTFTFYLTDYAHFLASYQNKIPKQYQCRNIYVSALIETSDNLIVFGKMGINSFDAGRYQFIGGGVDFNCITGEEINFTKCIENELYEELSIDSKKHIDYLTKIYLGINKYGPLSVIYKVKLKISSCELNCQLKNYNKNLEVDKLLFVNKNNYEKKIAEILKKDKNCLDANLEATLDAYFNKHMLKVNAII